MVQWMQNLFQGYHESLLTLLFEHVLGYLVKELEGEDLGMHATNVEGGAQHCRTHTQWPKTSLDPTMKLLRQCWNYFCTASITLKSRLHTYLSRTVESSRNPSLLPSPLPDHFKSIPMGEIKIFFSQFSEKVTYLLHREIEPGRMIIMLTWLHTISKNEDFMVDEFRKEACVALGDFFEEEINNAQMKRGLDGGLGGNQEGTSPKGNNTRVVTSCKASKQASAKLLQ
eukprot:scaffold35840_cov51-Attheya_sp.AAC.3